MGKFNEADNMPQQSELSDAKGEKNMKDPGSECKQVDKSARDKDSISLNDSSSEMCESSHKSKLS